MRIELRNEESPASNNLSKRRKKGNRFCNEAETQKDKVERGAVI